jgi:SAM-dependent methyltransferase
MIDLGCGSKPYQTMMNELGIAYSGADIGPNADLPIDCNGRVPRESDSADAVLSIQVLEHVRDLDTYCAEIGRLLRRDGTLFLSTHGTWLYHPHPEDHRRWTRTGLIAELGARGLMVQDVVAIMGPLATTTIIRLTGFAFVARKLPLLGGLLAGAMAIAMNLRAMVEDLLTPYPMRLDNACVYFVRARKVSA